MLADHRVGILLVISYRMKYQLINVSAALLLLAASAGVASADTLAVSCTGAASGSTVTWTATSTGGVAPVSFLWSDGSTSMIDVKTYAPGTYATTIQGTDASSSVATSVCSATIAQPLPSISSFIGTPSAIAAGQSSVLSWAVSNASSTSLDQGIGAITSTSITVTPSVTTTYTLSAINPQGTATATATVIVNATGSTVQQQIQALMAQIRALQQQIAQLISGAAASSTSSATTPPIGFVPPGQVGNAACMTFSRDLGEGSRGEDVTQLQQMLAGDPSLGFSVNPTGYFGQLTSRALARFQEQEGIASSTSGGTVGPLTRGFFERRCGGEGLTGGTGIQQQVPEQQQEQEQNGSALSSSSSATAASSSAEGLFHGWLNPFNPNGSDNGNGNGHGDN